jgi:CubicO group peptidase (beta-lactamase class C family)
LGGGIELNTVDLARFGWLVLSGQIVTPAVRDGRLWSPVRAGCVTPFGTSVVGACQHGLAWQLTKAGSTGTCTTPCVAQHGGSWTGARSYLRIYRNDGLVVAVMSNRARPRPNHNPATLVDDIAKTVLAP